MSCPGTWNILIVDGDILRETLVFTDDDDLPIDLSTYTEVAMQIRKKPSAEVLGEARLTTDGFKINGNNLSITGIEINFGVGNYMYDIEFIANGIRETLIRGVITVVPQSTII